MKKSKKFFAALLALVMMLAMTIPAYAAPASQDGEITITNAKTGYEYNIYKILDLVRYDETVDPPYYIYQAVAPWVDFVNSDAIKGVYLDVDADNYVTWVEGASAADFAKLALAEAKDKGFDAVDTATAASDTVVFDGLDLGYYLVDSSVGALCMLDTAHPTAEIAEKNDVPTIEKEVDKATANIGDTVNYTVTIEAKKGAEGYVMHDTMSAGLTFNDDVAIAGVDAANYSVVKNAADGCTFEIVFNQAYLDTLTADTTLTVTYSAQLNADAVIAGDGNTNTVDLEYGDDNRTEESQVTTKTYEFELVKTDAANAVLDGAEFTLSINDTPIAFVAVEGGYRVATADDENTTTTIVAGDVKITGLANGTYSLEETKAPQGFNGLEDALEVVIADANNNATVTDGVWEANGVHVVNQAGGLLPSTGGIGTTIFYIGGGVLVVAAIIFLVTKKRVNSEEA